MLRTAMRVTWAVTRIDSIYLGVIRGFFKIHKTGSQKPKNGCWIYNHGSLNMWEAWSRTRKFLQQELVFICVHDHK